MREVVLDTETTGLDEQNHRIIEIGIVEIYDKIPTGNTFHTYINPEREIDPEAEAVHGLSLQFLTDKPKFSEIISECLEFIGKAPIVAHNISFDMKFFNKELERLQIPALKNKYIDTLEIARKKFGSVRLSLDMLCSRFDIPTGHRNLHGALIDAELLTKVYYYLSIQYDDIFCIQKVQQSEKIDIQFTKRDFDSYFTEAERIAHEKMMPC